MDVVAWIRGKDYMEGWIHYEADLGKKHGKSINNGIIFMHSILGR